MDRLASTGVLTEPWMAASSPPRCFINNHGSGFFRRTRLMGECDWLLIRTKVHGAAVSASLCHPSGGPSIPERLVYPVLAWLLLRRWWFANDIERDAYPGGGRT